jgi:hypothetical protein
MLILDIHHTAAVQAIRPRAPRYQPLRQEVNDVATTLA